MKRYIVFGALMVLMIGQHKVLGQTVDWFTGGNTGLNSTTSFLGTTDGVPINFRTNNLRRMRLINTLSTIINGFPTAPRDGFLLLSTRQDAYTNALSRAPFTRLHF